MQRARGLVLGLLAIILIGGCARIDKKTAVAPPDSTVVDPPRIVLLTVLQNVAVGWPVWAGLLVSPGTNSLSEAAFDFDGDGRPDTTISAHPARQVFSAVHIFTHTGEQSIKAWIRDDHGMADSTTRLVHILPCLFDVTMGPRSGIAPVQTTATIRHVVPDSFLVVSVDWTNDGIFDTTFVPRSDVTILWHIFSRVGTYLTRVRAQLRDTVMLATDTLQALNTPPQGVLPRLITTSDSTLGPVSLPDYFTDHQTTSWNLNYTLLQHSGPAELEISNDTLFFAFAPGTQGSGSATILVSDGDGGTVDAVQDYLITLVAVFTDAYLALTDIETGDSITTGIFTVNRRAYAVTPERHIAHATFFSVPQVQVSGYEGNTCAAFSFENSFFMQGERDTSLALRLITYSGLDTSAGEQDQFRNFNQETRDVPVPASPSSEGLASFDFGRALRDTIWIARNGYTGLAFTVTEQQDIESLVRSNLYPILRENQRPVIYLANENDPLPWQSGIGPTRNNLILVSKADMPAVTVYDLDHNGDLERADVQVSSTDPGETLRGILSALVAPMPVINSVRPEQSILHPQSTRSDLSVMDRKMLAVAAAMPPGLPFDDVFRFPA